ncbi:MAG: cation:proton antiporter [Nanoarchaeota archaeon]
MVTVTSEIFLQLGLVVSIAAGVAFILRLLKQPQILAYVLAGILITPVFGLLTDISLIQSMSILGIAFLLFLVGLEMDLKALKSVAHVSMVGGLIQIALLFVTGYLVALLLNYLPLQAAYVGLMIAFSSTMVVMKLLSDKRELNTLHGRLGVCILLLEDIIAIFAISLLSSIDQFSLTLLGLALLKFISIFIVAFLLSKYLFPLLFRYAAKHQELLLILSLAVCFLFGLGFYKLGFSIAIGAFVAGIALGNLEYNLEIISKVKSLRDFFALLFFVSLGMGLSFSALKGVGVTLAVLLAVILLIKPFITMTVCSLFKYTKKPSFLTALSLAQIGEFSLIIAAQGLALGHISSALFSTIVVVTLISITFTSYFIKYEHWFYRLFQKPLKIFDFFTTEGLEYLPSEVRPRIILCGYNRIGYSILRSLQHVKNKVLVVDYNPEIIAQLVKEGYHCLYGDVADEEIMERMNLPQVQMLISTVPELADNQLLIKRVQQAKANKRAKIIVTAADIDDALKLYHYGADYVILPHFLGGEHVSQLINEVHDGRRTLHEEKKKHIFHLHERKGIGHRHPKT